MKKLLIGYMAAVAILIALSGCDQDKVVYSGHSYLMFSDTLYTYAVQETNEIFKVPVAATAPVDYDRTLAVEVIDRNSNAVEGKHYKILSNTVTIKAGELTTHVDVQGNYDNIDIVDSLGFALRLIVPETEQWEMYGTETKVVMHKLCPFDIQKFTGHCVVSSTYFKNYMNNVDLRLVSSEVVEGKENTIVIHDLYYDGYDIEITFNREDVLEPLVEMEEQICSTTGGAFNTVYGDGKLRMSLPTAYNSYFSTNENFVLLYTLLTVKRKDGTLYSNAPVGTFVNVIEWISEAEAEKLKEQGY